MDFRSFLPITKNKIIPTAFLNLYTFLSCEASVFTPPFLWNFICLCNLLRQLVASLPRTSVPKVFALPSPLSAFDDPANIQRRVCLPAIGIICLSVLFALLVDSPLSQLIKQHFFDCNSLQRFLRNFGRTICPFPFSCSYYSISFLSLQEFSDTFFKKLFFSFNHRSIEFFLCEIYTDFNLTFSCISDICRGSCRYREPCCCKLPFEQRGEDLWELQRF